YVTFFTVISNSFFLLNQLFFSVLQDGAKDERGEHGGGESPAGSDRASPGRSGRAAVSTAGRPEGHDVPLQRRNAGCPVGFFFFFVHSSSLNLSHIQPVAIPHVQPVLFCFICLHRSYVCGQRQAGVKEEEVVSKLEAEVEQLEEDLKRQTQMNGVSLTSCTTKTLRRTSRKCVQEFSVSGHCFDLDFQVEFQISEFKQGQRSERTISNLNVVIDAGDLQCLGSFLSGVEESSDLLLLFRTLRTFSDRCDDRCRTFQHFQVSKDTPAPTWTSNWQPQFM
uniref:Centromere protein P n=1 Tax=Scophthalmus maximus TaxID=52904 RepID=A0A8D3CC51_SCOMX